MIWEKYGYRKMFDETLQTMKRTWEVSDTIPYQENLIDKGITDVISYDPCFQPEYYRQFYYVLMGDRKYKWAYPELNEIWWVLDYPYYYEKVDIDDIFNIPKDLWVSKNKNKRWVDKVWLNVDLSREHLRMDEESYDEKEFSSQKK